MSIADTAEHMVVEMRLLFKDTAYSDNFRFYYDALSLMTAKTIINYMVEKDYLKYWVPPEMDLYKRYPKLKSYHGRPPGNSPEFCLLNSNLNQDLYLSVNRHVRMIKLYHADDLRRFSLATPARATNAYLRIFNKHTGVALTSKRIVEDTLQIVEALKKVVAAKGTVVADINNRTGRRREKNPESMRRTVWTGNGKKKLQEDDYGDIPKESLHLDTWEALCLHLQGSHKRFASLAASNQNPNIIPTIDQRGISKTLTKNYKPGEMVPWLSSKRSKRHIKNTNEDL